MPPHEVLRAEVDAIWHKPQNEKTERELLGGSKENIPLYHIVFPHIFKLAMAAANLTLNDARKAFRCEYYKKFPEVSSSNAFRQGKGHPFAKRWGMKPQEIMKSWQKVPTSNWPLFQSYPDLSLSAPFHFNILFEAKYFESDDIGSAEVALVEGVYETVFYRGLPPSDGWGHDFGCLLAIDASKGANLKAAWDSVVSKKLFWDDANIFVMILRDRDEPAI